MPRTLSLVTPQNARLIHQHVAVSMSTNSELLQALASGKVSKSKPYMLTASMQTAGRGQHARTWQSPPGNIYLSLYHPLSTPLSGLLSLVVGYHLTQLPIIQNLNRQRKSFNLPLIGVKWANDVGFYYATKPSCQDKHSHQHADVNTVTTHTAEAEATDKNLTRDSTDQIKQTKSFFKLAGILIEPVFTNSQIVGVVVGVGINIKDAPHLCETKKEGMDYHAISLNQIIAQTQSTTLSATPRAEDLYTSVGAALLKAVAQFTRFAHDAYALPQFLTDYATVNVLVGRNIYVIQSAQGQVQAIDTSQKTQPTSKVIQGVVVGINADGSLKLRPTDTDEAARCLDIYTGTIRLA